MIFSFRIIMGLAIFVTILLPNQAQAHRFAPSLFKIVETTQDNYNVVWKTPTEVTSNVPLRPTWPVSCVVKTENPVVREGTGTVSSWTLVCDQVGGSGGLVGGGSSGQSGGAGPDILFNTESGSLVVYGPSNPICVALPHIGGCSQ